MNNNHERHDRLDADGNRLENDHADANRDPITGQPGAHPVGTGIGAAAAGTIGAAVGAPAGPIGAAIGAVVGSVVGGLIGKGAAETFDPTVEDTYWRDNYKSRPYVKPDHSYDDYHPAYRTGYEGYTRYSNRGQNFHEVEPDLQRDYETNHTSSRVGWNDAKYAAQDAWDRVRYNSMSRDEDEYWRQNYASQPYYEQGASYDAYQPAYRMGYESYGRYKGTGRTFDDVEPELRRDYERDHGSSGLGWEKAKHAARASWNRVEHTFR